jgi:hypothetical protein
MRIRLKERCQFLGRIYERGEEVILPDGVRGPHRTVQKSMDKIDYGTNPPIDANRIIGDVVDVPLYEEVADQPVDHSKEQKEQAEAAALARKDATSRAAQAREVKPIPESEPLPAEQPNAVRDLTHIEERERR